MSIISVPLNEEAINAVLRAEHEVSEGKLLRTASPRDLLHK